MAANSYLRQNYILQDFTVWINGRGLLGESPGFQPPNVKLQVEEFRGGGMDGTVEIPFGIEKLEFDFDLHTWDPAIFSSMGYGAGSLDVPILFKGHLITPYQATGSVLIKTKSLIKEIKPSKVQSGKKTELTVTCIAHVYEHLINNNEVEYVSVFDKHYRVGGKDLMKSARTSLGMDIASADAAPIPVV
jgi:P2 family phage contractile tail tube protein